MSASSLCHSAFSKASSFFTGELSGCSAVLKHVNDIHDDIMRLKQKCGELLCTPKRLVFVSAQVNLAILRRVHSLVKTSPEHAARKLNVLFHRILVNNNLSLHSAPTPKSLWKSDVGSLT